MKYFVMASWLLFVPSAWAMTAEAHSACVREFGPCQCLEPTDKERGDVNAYRKRQRACERAHHYWR
jgi:hypothetical protein